jgi:tyrosyl-tRNA synthetase
MSKSLNNAIGIPEAPLEMYGKLMSISDELMWRYYELLTDISSSDIESMKSRVKSGKAHPMQLKKELAERIVSDFHSQEAAKRAGEDWAKQFQKDEIPEHIEALSISFKEVESKFANGTAIKLDKLMTRSGMAESASDAQRKIKARAVRVDGEVHQDPVLPIKIPAEFVLRVGRMLKRVSIS